LDSLTCLTKANLSRESDSDNGKWCKYVHVTTNQPDAKSKPNPNSNPTTKQLAIVSIKLQGGLKKLRHHC